MHANLKKKTNQTNQQTTTTKKRSVYMEQMEFFVLGVVLFNQIPASNGKPYVLLPSIGRTTFAHDASLFYDFVVFCIYARKEEKKNRLIFRWTLRKNCFIVDKTKKKTCTNN